jgi:hypothetical protein
MPALPLVYRLVIPISTQADLGNVQKPVQKPAQTRQDPIISFEYKTLKLLKRMLTDACMGHSFSA